MTKQYTIKIIFGHEDSPTNSQIYFDEKPPTNFTKRGEFKIALVEDGVISDKALNLLVDLINNAPKKDIFKAINNFRFHSGWHYNNLDWYITTNLDTDKLSGSSLNKKNELVERIVKDTKVKVSKDLEKELDELDEFDELDEDAWRVTPKGKQDMLVRIGEILQHAIDVVNREERAKQLEEVLKDYPLNRYTIDIPYDVNPKFGDDNINCLKDFMLKSYCYISSKANQVAKSKIDNHFDKDTTIQGAIDFLQANKIPYDIRDVTGSVIAKRTDSYGLKNKKILCRFMVYNNHIYKCNVNGRTKKYTPELLPTNDNEVIVADVDQNANEYFRIFNSSTVSNYSYYSEVNMYPTAVCRSPILTKGKYVTYDMKKCYYNILFKMCIEDMNEDRIGIFHAVDLIEEYKQEDIEDHFVYFVSKEGLDKLEKYGWNKSMLHGFNVKMMIRKKVISKRDITHVKVPSGYTTVGYIRERMDKVEKILQELNKTTEKTPKYFRLCNGIMGKKFSGDKDMIVRVRSDDDIKLLKASYPNSVTSVKEDDDVTRLTIRRRTSKYLHFNSRSIYDYVVNRANYFVNEFQFEVEKLNYSVYNIRTDSLQIKAKDIKELESKLSTTKMYQWFIKEKVKAVTIDEETCRDIYIEHMDINKIIEETKNEIRDNMKTIEVIQGKPGTGKTTRMKNTYDYDHCMTVTNLCCRNMDTDRVRAETIRMGLESKQDGKSQYESLTRYKNKKIWLDEFSMFEPHIYDSIMYLSTIVESMKITGDINQIPPCMSSNIFEEKKQFFDLFLENATILTKDYRNEPNLIEFRDMIIDNDPDMTEIEREEFRILRIKQSLRRKINKDMTAYVDNKGNVTENVMNHLASIHKTCDFVNQEILKQYGLVADFESDTYSEGVQLKAGVSIHKLELYNSSKWYIKSINGNDCVLVNMDTADELDFPVKKIKDVFTLGYCSTVHSAQGTGIVGGFVIHNPLDIYNWSKNILYTAVTRGKDLSDLILTNTEVPDDFENTFQCSQISRFSRINSVSNY